MSIVRGRSRSSGASFMAFSPLARPTDRAWLGDHAGGAERLDGFDVARLRGGRHEDDWKSGGGRIRAQPRQKCRPVHFRHLHFAQDRIGLPIGHRTQRIARADAAQHDECGIAGKRKLDEVEGERIVVDVENAKNDVVMEAHIVRMTHAVISLQNSKFSSRGRRIMVWFARRCRKPAAARGAEIGDDGLRLVDTESAAPRGCAHITMRGYAIRYDDTEIGA